MNSRAWVIFICGLLSLLGLFSFILPSLGSAVFLSPDETAIAVMARRFGAYGSLQIQSAPVCQPSTLACSAFPWLHPRSLVMQGEQLVPVGFLGLPILVGIVWRLFGELSLGLFTPLLVLSAIYPLWSLARRFGHVGQLVTVTVWLSFPTVILYANRGLFPNLPAVCLAVWAVHLIISYRPRPYASIFSAGIFAGLALAIRPIEVVWVAPWLWMAWKYRTPSPVHSSTRTLIVFLAGLILIGSLTSFVTWKTYGSPLQVGYLLRDTGPTTTPTYPSALSSLVSGDHRVWPFGFHPSHIWFNFQAYIVGFLGPWFGLALLASALTWWRRPRARPGVLLGVWTLFMLLLIYGEALYQDHVGLNVISSGNSLLRYVLPVAPFFALSAGAIAEWLHQKQGGKLITCIVVTSLVSLGLWTALRRDDEGLMFARQELRAYQAIRQLALVRLGSNAIVLSERSDKLFFPDLRVASPLPPLSEIASLVKQSATRVAVFSPTLDELHLTSWRAAGLVLQPVFTLEARRQTMYVLSHRAP